MCNTRLNNLHLSCEKANTIFWQSHRCWTKSDRLRILEERRKACEACPNNPDKQTSESNSSNNSNSLTDGPPKLTPPTIPTSELEVTPKEVERIASLMTKCLACEKAKYEKVDAQPSAAGFIPRTLRLAFTRAEYIHGVANLTCSERPGCCQLSKAMKDGECEGWKGR